mmetsp:Transcript_10878/g.23020  ORF Transcript_10878/g.23020 Transcript_10878/m.23020 type:complete len:336 (-) Transcript_10878:1019-2026(-)
MPPSCRVTSQLLIVIVVSFIVWNQIGSFTECAPSLSAKYSLDIKKTSPYDTYSGPLRRIRSYSRVNRNATKFQRPYPCGVFLFYHIPSTGGASINQWLLKYSNYKYYTMWGIEVDKNGNFNRNPKKIENSFVNGMNEHVQNLGPNEWRIAHSHILSTYMNESEKELYHWRNTVEAQGCQMINAVMLRDPLNHAMSLYKVIESKSSTREEWTKYLESPTAPGLWATQLDFFLYNNFGRRNPYGVSKEEKVRRGLELLEMHFDIVAVADHGYFVSEVLNMTGWEYIKMPVYNVHRGKLSYTKKEVEDLNKLLTANGDIDFFDAVKIRYTGALSYLER